MRGFVVADAPSSLATCVPRAIAMTPVTEVEQLKQQNALLLRRLLAVSRERDALAKQVAALQPEPERQVAK